MSLSRTLRGVASGVSAFWTAVEALIVKLDDERIYRLFELVVTAYRGFDVKFASSEVRRVQSTRWPFRDNAWQPHGTNIFHAIPSILLESIQFNFYILIFEIKKSQ
jgi:hypothetical protein